MSKGKYYSLEEARNANDVEGFAKASPSVGDVSLFDATLVRMAKNQPLAHRKDKWGRNVDYNDTQTLQDTDCIFKDAQDWLRAASVTTFPGCC